MKTNPIKCPVQSDVNPELKSLIESMLMYDEESRISWEELFAHKLFN
jgi:serine/threonine protein kinase